MKQYIAATKNENNKYYAFVLPVNESDNIIPIILREQLKTANIFSTRRKAQETVDYWNYCYQQNGNYLY